MSRNIILNEKVLKYEEKLKNYNLNVNNNNIIISERNMLIEEKKNWNDTFRDILQRCRSMAGEPPLDSNVNVENTCKFVLTDFTNYQQFEGR